MNGYKFLGKAMVLLASTIGFGNSLDLIEEPINLEGVTIGTPAMGGSGCPQGTVLPILDRKNKELLIFFDAYVVEADRYTRTARKSCSLSIPIHLPNNVGVSLIGERIEGFNILPEGGSTVLNTESFFAGSHGEVVSTRFDGSLEDTFEVENAIAVSGNETSCCGVDTNLRVNTSLRVKTNAYGDYALSGITALSKESKSLVYQLKFASCGQ